MLRNWSYTSVQVVRPTTPSTVRPYLRWKARTAAAVLELSYCASVFSQNCSCSTALPVEPVRRVVPPQVPSERVPLEVSPSLVSSARSLTDT